MLIIVDLLWQLSPSNLQLVLTLTTENIFDLHEVKVAGDVEEGHLLVAGDPETPRLALYSFDVVLDHQGALGTKVMSPAA
jgi:hypothetical protein